MEAFSALLAFRAWKSPVTGEFPSLRPVAWSFDVLFDLRLNKRLGGTNPVAGDLRCHRTHYDVTAMLMGSLSVGQTQARIQFWILKTLKNWELVNIRCQNLTWTNLNTLSIAPTDTYFGEMWIKRCVIHQNALANVVCKMSVILFRSQWDQHKMNENQFMPALQWPSVARGQAYEGLFKKKKRSVIWKKTPYVSWFGKCHGQRSLHLWEKFICFPITLRPARNGRRLADDVYKYKGRWKHITIDWNLTEFCIKESNRQWVIIGTGKTVYGGGDKLLPQQMMILVTDTYMRHQV